MALDQQTANTLYANMGIKGYSHCDSSGDSTKHITRQHCDIQKLRGYRGIVAEILNQLHESYRQQAIESCTYYDGNRDEIVKFLDSLGYGDIVSDPYSSKAIKFLLYDFEAFVATAIDEIDSRSIQSIGQKKAESKKGTHWSKIVTSDGYRLPTEWAIGMERNPGDKNAGCQASWESIASQETKDHNSYHGNNKCDYYGYDHSHKQDDTYTYYTCKNQATNEYRDSIKAEIDSDNGYTGRLEVHPSRPVDESILSHPIVEQSAIRPIPQKYNNKPVNTPIIIELNGKEFTVDSKPKVSKVRKTRKYHKHPQQRSRNLVKYHINDLDDMV